MTNSEKVCRNLFAKRKWNIRVCEAFCSKTKRFKCKFLDARIREGAAKEVKPEELEELFDTANDLER